MRTSALGAAQASPETALVAFLMAPPASTEEGEFDSFHDFNPKARPRPPGSPAKQIERCVISSFRVAESMGFKRDFRQWEELLRIGD